MTRFLALFGALFMFSSVVSALYNIFCFAQTSPTSIFWMFFVGFVLSLPLVIEVGFELMKGE